MTCLSGKPYRRTAADTARKKPGMGVTNYINVGETIIGEHPVGGTRINYAVDALHSVIGTIVAGDLENTYANKPYGAKLSKTGVGGDPAFTWLGSLGYRSTDRSWSEIYVRHRSYGCLTARWTTVDPKWPAEAAFPYCKCNPTTNQDPSGLCPESVMIGCIVINPFAAELCCALYDALFPRDICDDGEDYGKGSANCSNPKKTKDCFCCPGSCPLCCRTSFTGKRLSACLRLCAAKYTSVS